VSKVPMSELGN